MANIISYWTVLDYIELFFFIAVWAAGNFPMISLISTTALVLLEINTSD